MISVLICGLSLGTFFIRLAYLVPALVLIVSGASLPVHNEASISPLAPAIPC